MDLSTSRITGMTIAVHKMKAMLVFYEKVFHIKFVEEVLQDFKLYRGGWNDLEILFCPAKLAQNTAKQNRHQLTVWVPNLDHALAMVVDHGGEVMGPIQETAFRQVGIYDPDRNSFVLKEIKK